MKISEHLTIKEATKSATATRLGIDNSPTIAHLEALKTTAEMIFEPVRKHFNVPIAVTSGYRSKALNDAIKGSSRSQHCHGQALDIDADVFGGLTNKEIFEFIKNKLDFDQLIWEFGDDNNPAWVHVSYTPGVNRGEVLKAFHADGRTKYKKFK